MPHTPEQPNKGGDQLETIHEMVDAVINEVESILRDNPFESREERDYYLSKLDTALAMSNNPKVRELIKYIRERYPD